MLCFYRKIGYIEGGFIILEEEGFINQQRGLITLDESRRTLVRGPSV